MREGFRITMTPEEKYLNDPTYASLVDSLYAFIVSAQFTPSELREACIFAAIKYEHHRPVPDWDKMKKLGELLK